LNSSKEASFSDEDSSAAGLTGSMSRSGDGVADEDEEVEGSYALVVLGVHGAGVLKTAISSSVLHATGGISISISCSIL